MDYVKLYFSLFVLMFFLNGLGCEPQPKTQDLTEFQGKKVLATDFSKKRDYFVIFFSDQSKLKIYVSYNRSMKVISDHDISSYANKTVVRVDYDPTLINVTFTDGTALKFKNTWYRDSVYISITPGQKQKSKKLDQLEVINKDFKK